MSLLACDGVSRLLTLADAIRMAACLHRGALRLSAAHSGDVMQELEQARLVRNHFDEVSGAWERLYTPEVTFANYNFVVRKRHVLDLFDKRGGRFLDAGCGTGDFIPDLLERGG